MTDEKTEHFFEILQLSQDRDSLEAAAVALASSDDPRAVGRFGEFLRRSEFLARLDNLNDSEVRTLHLRQVMAALEAHPSRAVGELCVMLSKKEDFLADDERMDFLLETLSAVRPMTEEGVELFRRINTEGYFAFNAPLLAKNGSPRALELFESMMKDRTVDLERRVDCLHTSILPHRTSLPILTSAERLLSADLEEGVAIGLIETLFDFQSKRWFGPAIGAPRPPTWESASNEALEVVLSLAAKAKARGGLPQSVLEAVERTASTASAILARKKP